MSTASTPWISSVPADWAAGESRAPSRRSILAGRGRAVVMARTAVVAGALLLLLTRPLSPWWLSADCDAAYVASALNLLAGKPTEKLDHPGMPLQGLLTVSFAVDQTVRGWWSGISREAYIDLAFHDMASTLWMVRAWAMAFFLCAVLAAFEISRCMFGSCGAGVAGALLFAACPGSLTHATTFRPENLLAALNMVFVYQLWLSLRTQSATRLLFATAILGVAITVKIHSIGLLPLLGLAAWRAREWALRDVTVEVCAWWRGPWRTCVLGLAGLFALVVAWMNGGRDWTAIDMRLMGVAVGALAWLATSIAVRRDTRRVPIAGLLLSPIAPAILLALVIGAALPNTLFMDQLTPMARAMWWTVSGSDQRGSLNPLSLVESVIRQWSQASLVAALPMVAVGIVGVWRALRGRRTDVLIFAAGAALMFVLAALRGGAHASPHHYGPALVLAIPVVLAALEGRRNSYDTRKAEGLATASSHRPVWCATAALAVCGWPIFASERAARGQADRCRAIADLTDLCKASAWPEDVILCDYWAQNADAAHFMLARECSSYTPERRYRSLPDSPTGLAYAAQRGLRPAYYLTSGDSRTRVEPDKEGRWIARGVWGTTFQVQALDTRPLDGLVISAWSIVGPVEVEPEADTPEGEAAPIIEATGDEMAARAPDALWETDAVSSGN